MGVASTWNKLRAQSHRHCEHRPEAGLERGSRERRPAVGALCEVIDCDGFAGVIGIQTRAFLSLQF